MKQEHTDMTKTHTHFGDFVVYQARAHSLWIVRNKITGQEVSHEDTKAAALKAARMFRDGKLPR